MLARSMGQRPPLTPGAIGNRRSTPPRHHTKEPSSKRCSSEGRCSVDNLLRIGPSYAAWEDPRLTDNPQRMQVTRFICVAGNVFPWHIHVGEAASPTSCFAVFWVFKFV